MPDVWYQFTCPNCREANLVCNGDPNDQTVSDVDGFNCWGCGKGIGMAQDELGDDLTDDFDEPLLLVRDDPCYYKQGYPLPKLPATKRKVKR